MNPSKPEHLHLCPECQAGQMRLKFVTFYTWLADELITVPDFPAWVCDICRNCDYDGRAITQLNLLLTPNAGRPAPTIPLRPRQPYIGKNQRAITE